MLAARLDQPLEPRAFALFAHCFTCGKDIFAASRIAEGLASRGIAVLRYTKRTHAFGAGLGGGPLSSFTLSEELGDDARAAVSVIASRSDIDHRQIYLLGHSMGGVAVPPIAADDPRIAGIVVMGTPAGDLLTVLIKRSEDGAAE